MANRQIMVMTSALNFICIIAFNLFLLGSNCLLTSLLISVVFISLFAQTVCHPATFHLVVVRAGGAGKVIGM